MATALVSATVGGSSYPPRPVRGSARLHVAAHLVRVRLRARARIRVRVRVRVRARVRFNPNPNPKPNQAHHWSETRSVRLLPALVHSSGGQGLVALNGSPPCPLWRAAPSAGFGVAHVAAHHSSVTWGQR